jgi:hypothetical protein
VERAYKLGLYDLTRDAALKGAYWAIESKRPSAAGEFTAIELLSNFMLEKYHLDFLVGLLVIAREKLSHKRYQQYYKALKRQLLHSDKTGVVWNKIEQIEKTLNTPDS